MNTIGATMLKTTTGALALAVTLTSCTGQPVAEMNATIAKSEVASATPATVLIRQAHAAEAAGNPAAAVSFAELAVRAEPNNAEAREVLAKAYMSAGRYGSAADAYGDLHAMGAADAGMRFRGALAELAAGRTDGGLAVLNELSSRPEMAADIGLALALGGKPEDAVALLTDAVRSGQSDARTRQNLALAQALAGEWAAARATASVDLTPDQVDARVAEWASIASSSDSAWRTQHLLGIAPAAEDAGRPVQLAWAPPTPVTVPGQEPVMQAEATTDEAPAVEVAGVSPPAIQVAEVSPPAVEVAEVSPQAVTPQQVAPQPAVLAVPASDRNRLDSLFRRAEMQAPVAAATLPAPKPDSALPVTFGQKSSEKAPEKAELATQVSRELPPLPKQTGGIWVVQLGSYAALDYLVEGWHGLLQKNKTLGDYTPLKSSIELEGETYYRLSVGTFATLDDADALCENLEAAGQKCFIRKGEGADDGDAKAA